MGVLLPALGKAREQARQIVCRNNLRMLVVGAMAWSEDHSGWAIAGDWFKDPGQNEEESSLLPYINSSRKRKDSSLVCPSAKHIQFFHVDDEFLTAGNERKFTYAANGYITLNLAPYGEGSPGIQGPSDPMTSGGYKGPKNVYWTVHGVTPMIHIRKPAETVFFIDHEYYAAFSWTFDPTKPLSSFPDDYKYKTRWHNIKSGSDYGIGMIGWVDGHCSKEPADFTEKYKVGDKEKPRWKYYFYDH
jgi:hypothetical protein